MNIHRTSYFKKPSEDLHNFRNWVARLEAANGRNYLSTEVETALGLTHIWTLKPFDPEQPSILVFPGARTTVLFWDLDKGLESWIPHLNVFLVETNGLPNLSDGHTPDIKGLGYGYWAKQIMDKIGVEEAFVAGASFGGLIAMKLSIVCSERVLAAFLLNPGCLQPFSMTLKNLYANVLPIISPSEKNVRKFLDTAIFCKPKHQLSPEAEQLLVDYEILALKKYKDNSQKPYAMDDELNGVKVPVYLMLGVQDLLFPFQKSLDNANKWLENLKEVKVYQEVGHGIETFKPALDFVLDKINDFE